MHLRNVIRESLITLGISLLILAATCPQIHAEDFFGDLGDFDFGEGFGFFDDQTSAAQSADDEDEVAPGVPGSYSMAARGRDVELYIEDSTGHIAVRDLRSGFVWKSRPSDSVINVLDPTQLWREHMSSTIIVQYTTSERSWVRTTDTKRGNPKVEVSKIENGARLTYEFSDLGIVIPLHYRLLADDSLEVTIPEEGLCESEDTLITSIGLLPFFGAQGDDVEGYLFYPDGCGAISYFKTEHPQYDQGFSGEVYGPNLYWWDLSNQTGKLAHVPVFGIKAEQSALIGIVDKGSHDVKINSSPSGYMVELNRAYAEFIYRRPFNMAIRADVFVEMQEKRRIKGDRSVIYSFLDGEDADYSGMAHTYRDYLIANGSLRESVLEEELPLDLEIFHGAVRTTLLGDKVITVTTFEDVKSIVEAILRTGVKALNVTLIGWGQRGSADYPNRLPPDKAFGGVRGLKELVRWVESLDADVRLFLRDNYVIADKSRGGFSVRNDVIREPNQLPHNDENLYILKPQVSYEFALNDIPEIVKYGVHGIEFEEFGTFLMSEGSKGEEADRETVAGWYGKIMDLASELGLRVAVSEGNAWTLKYVDRIADIPMRSSGFLFEDESVPFYQMVLHGSLLYSGEASNRRHSAKDQLLREIEYGAVPRYILVHDDPEMLWKAGVYDYYNGVYTRWLDDIREEYHLVHDRLGDTWRVEMQRHDKLAEGVYKTTYVDGTSIYVNYNDTRYCGDGVVVEPKDFHVVSAR